MNFTVEQVAFLISGEIIGDPTTKVDSLGKIQDAGNTSLAFLENMKYEQYLYSTNAAAVIIPKDFTPQKKVSTTLIKVSDPRASFSSLLEEYHKMYSFQKQGVETPSFLGENSTFGEKIFRGAFSYIGKNCKIGQNVKIHPHVYIGDNCVIGDHCIFYAGVKIYDNTIIGNHCTIQSGAVIGSDGFGFVPRADGSYKTVPQVGNVIIENHVDIGANTVIDCATMGSTIIKEGVKLDNLIQIAHNVEIGKHTVIAAQTGVSGSTKLGDYCMIGGQVGIVGHISIANQTKIGAQSGLNNNVETNNTTLSGSPAFDFRNNMKSYVVYKKLPELMKRIEHLEQKIMELVDVKS
jgi:UDP-3-O-[3-hydroxymyristoyl] glucosamine N-acyltransferase